MKIWDPRSVCQIIDCFLGILLFPRDPDDFDVDSKRLVNYFHVVTIINSSWETRESDKQNKKKEFFQDLSK